MLPYSRPRLEMAMSKGVVRALAFIIYTMAVSIALSDSNSQTLDLPGSRLISEATQKCADPEILHGRWLHDGVATHSSYTGARGVAGYWQWWMLLHELVKPPCPPRWISPWICGSTQEPAIGDIMVRDWDGAVAVYYTDGMHRPRWTPICTSTAGYSVLTAICRQLGYEGAKLLPGPFSPEISHDHTLTKHREQIFNASDEMSLAIDCGDESAPHSHILQCDYSVSDTCTSQDHYILRNTSFSCEGALNASPYKGQVYLCPPNEFPIGKCSISTGLVRVWAYDEWRGINQNSSKSPLESHVADSICRQLGYTNAVVNSAVTLNATTLSYSHCYYMSITAQALVTTDQLSCSVSHNCLGCCFKKYPQDEEDFCSECKNITDIVLSCMFDPTVSNSEESSSCTFDRLTCNPQLQGQILTKILELLLSIVGIYSIVITLTFICIQIFVYRKYCRRQHKNDQGAALNRERVFIDKNNFYNKSLNNYSVAR